MTILTVFLQMLSLLVMIAAGVIAAKGKMILRSQQKETIDMKQQIVHGCGFVIASWF